VGFGGLVGLAGFAGLLELAGQAGRAGLSTGGVVGLEVRAVGAGGRLEMAKGNVAGGG